MFEKIIDYFVSEPKRLRELGIVLWRLGSGILVIALIGNIATTGTSSLANLANSGSHAKTLADLYPALPTWWVPESVIGAIPAACLCWVGLWCERFGKRIQLIWKH